MTLPLSGTVVNSGGHSQTLTRLAATNDAGGAVTPAALPAGTSNATKSADGQAAAIASGNASQYALGNGAQSNGTQNIGAQAESAHKNALQSNGEQANGSQSDASQSGGQSAQHPQADATQANPATPRALDGAGQAQPVPVQVTTGNANGSATSPTSTVASGDTPRAGVPGRDTAPAPTEADEPVSASGINAAKLLQNISGTEMRVGMNSAEFGNISIRAAVSQQQMMAQISLDHSDLSQAIAAHIATAQFKLGSEYGLHASIEVNQQGTSFSGGSASSQAGSGGAGNSAQREQRDFIRSSGTEVVPAATDTDFGLGHAVLVSAGNGARLDINA
jgi:hypothetical protein